MAVKTKKVEVPDEVYEHKSEDKKLEVYREQHPVSPRTWDNYGVMTCKHKRLNLGDETPDTSRFEGWQELEESIKERHDVALILPLYIYNHGQVTISTTPFNNRWDSGQVGFIYVTENRLDEMGLSDDRRDEDSLRKILEGEVETYDQYLRNEVWRYEYEVNGDDEDSCGGFFGEEKSEFKQTESKR